MIVRRAPGGLWAGFWEFPTIHLSGADPAGRAFPDATVDLVEGVRRLSGITIEPGPVAHTVRFSVTKHRVTMTAHQARALGGRLRPGPNLDQALWERPEAFSDHPFGSAQRKLAAWVRDHGAANRR